MSQSLMNFEKGEDFIYYFIPVGNVFAEKWAYIRQDIALQSPQEKRLY